MKNFARSLAVHACILTLVILFGAAVHKVEKQRYRQSLIFPMTNLPVPTAEPQRTVTAPAVSARVAVARLAVGAPALLRASAAPQPVKLDTSSPLELPQVAQRAVTAAPIARQVGFGSPASAGNISGHSAATGGNASVQRAGFEMTRSAPMRPAVISAVRPDEPPVILSIPHAKHVEDGLSGRVLVKVILCADRSVKVLGVSEGLSPEQDAEALRIAGLVAFTPAMHQGQPVDHTATLVVEFLYSR